MHWIDRGPEPENLEQIRVTYTPGWVEHYLDKVGSLPRDSHWREFQGDLTQVFHGLCAYCEETCRGEVDHFRPKSRFPKLVYDWSNWLLACHDCNLAKGAKWPDDGYIDPCENSRLARPECYFTFDTLTGEMLPRNDLTDASLEKSRRMIEDLRLNAHHHLRKRHFLLWILSTPWQSVPESIPDELKSLVSDLISDVERMRDCLSSRSAQLSSVTRAWLSEQGLRQDPIS